MSHSLIHRPCPPKNLGNDLVRLVKSPHVLCQRFYFKQTNHLAPSLTTNSCSHESSSLIQKTGNKATTLLKTLNFRNIKCLADHHSLIPGFAPGKICLHALWPHPQQQLAAHNWYLMHWLNTLQDFAIVTRPSSHFLFWMKLHVLCLNSPEQ